MPVPRADFAVAVLNDSLLVMGGWNEKGQQLKSVDAFCLATSRSPHNLCEQVVHPSLVPGGAGRLT